MQNGMAGMGWHGMVRCGAFFFLRTDGWVIGRYGKVDGWSAQGWTDAGELLMLASPSIAPVAATSHCSLLCVQNVSGYKAVTGTYVVGS